MNENYIREFILDGGFIKEHDLETLENIMINQKLDFISAVIESDLVDKKILNKIISLVQGIPPVDLKKKIIDLETYLLIPEPVVRIKKIVPFFQDKDSVSIATIDTNLDYDFLKQFFPRKEIKLFLGDEIAINDKISEYQNLLKSDLLNSVSTNLKKITKIKDFGFMSENDLPDDYLSDISNNYYSEKFIKELLEYAHTSFASHIYITNGDTKNLISFRIFGHNYPIMEIEKDTIFSISLKLKKLADINIKSKQELIQNAIFKAELNNEIISISTSFIKTILGESISIELLHDKNFGTDFITIIKKQKEILYKNLNDSKGFYIIAGEKQSGKTKTTYALIEEEIKKNKEIYSLENNIVHQINYVNQILLAPGTKKELVLSKIILNSPDLIAIDYIKPYILKTLYNYVNFGGKVILGIKNDIKTFIDILLDFDFPKAGLVRNFNILLEHKKFKRLDPNKISSIKLSKAHWKILKRFISEKELLTLLKEEKIIDTSVKKSSEIIFHTKKRGAQDLGFVYIRGIIDLGLEFENLFLDKKQKEKIKNRILEKSKRSILENALILSAKKEVDLNEILKFLTK